jgi:hypothetical protein
VLLEICNQRSKCIHYYRDKAKCLIIKRV